MEFWGIGACATRCNSLERQDIFGAVEGAVEGEGTPIVIGAVEGEGAGKEGEGASPTREISLVTKVCLSGEEEGNKGEGV